MATKQMNNDYLKLPSYLWDVYRTASGKLFHNEQFSRLSDGGLDLSSREEQIITRAWQECQVQSGVASWDAEPCERCQEGVCICNAYPEGTFCLPPEEEVAQ